MEHAAEEAWPLFEMSGDTNKPSRKLLPRTPERPLHLPFRRIVNIAEVSLLPKHCKNTFPLLHRVYFPASSFQLS